VQYQKHLDRPVGAQPLSSTSNDNFSHFGFPRVAPWTSRGSGSPQVQQYGWDPDNLFAVSALSYPKALFLACRSSQTNLKCRPNYTCWSAYVTVYSPLIHLGMSGGHPTAIWPPDFSPFFPLSFSFFFFFFYFFPYILNEYGDKSQVFWCSPSVSNTRFSLPLNQLRWRRIASLMQDNKDFRHVKTYEVNLKDKDFVDGPWNQHNLDGGSCLIIPVPTP
jgi:hypothetical protein